MALFLAVIGSVGDAPAGAATAAESGVVHRYELDRFRQLDTLSGGGDADEFGAQVSDGFLATAPAAAGGGRIYFLSATGTVSSVSAAELSSEETARLGEDWADLGHPPGTDSALVFGAPGESANATDARAAAPSAVVVNYLGSRFTREVRRVAGTPGSLFGWRVRGTDSQVPASFNASYFVSAPLEDRGSKQRAGAVHKYDTDSGRRLWTFRGERAGELAGYDLLLAADANGDGLTDLLVGAPGSREADPAGRVYLLSGANGRVLDQLEAPEGAALFGYALLFGSSISALQGILVSAPATPKGSKESVGAIYAYADLNSEPQLFQGQRRDQWFGISMALNSSSLFVGSFERHRNAGKDGRGSVTVLSPTGRRLKTLRGRNGGDYFGRAISVGGSLAVGAPGAPPLLVPE